MARRYDHCPNCAAYVGTNESIFYCPKCGYRWEGYGAEIPVDDGSSTVIMLYGEKFGIPLVVLDCERDVEAFLARSSAYVPDGRELVPVEIPRCLPADMGKFFADLLPRLEQSTETNVI